MKIVFMGTPEFSVAALEKLIANNYEVLAVYTQVDKGVGRGRKIQYSPVKQCALEHGIEVLQPINFKNDADIAQLQQLKPDLMVVVAYGLILPQKVLDIPKYGCWNIHASLLPRWRGAAPIHRALLAGDKTTGVGIMQMEAGLDTGAVFVQHEFQIGKKETALQLHDKLAIMGANALIECLQLLEKDLLPEPMLQNHDEMTYAKKLDKAESKISWQETAEVLERKIRAFNPWPGVVAQINGSDFKLWQAEVCQSENTKEVGTIVKADKNTLIIQCQENQLRILEIQKPGKKRMPIAQFMQSRQDWFT
ncbi:MAG TPA: methionyl-tRNA formyltransferase [Oceanospirillales bacterium]|nr:methionyl-tRNA formyltransferase [Oceanospirillales bacterium]